MFDILQFIFWSITYFTVDFQIVKNLKHATPQFVFPRLACLLNFSWEFVALSGDILHHSFGLPLLIHVVWLSFDLLIVYNCAITLHRKHRIIFLISILPAFIGLFLWFQSPDGMLLSVFIIDVIMAIDFLVCATKLHNGNIYGIIIAVTKLIGDLFAWLFYQSQHIAVFYMGIVVLVCNSCYLFFVCVRIYKEKQISETRKQWIERRKALKQTVSQKKYRKGWQSTKKKYKKKK